MGVLMPVQHSRITHYIPPAKFAELVQEFVEPVPDDYFIHWLFRYRCMDCKHPGQEINEIVPRSRSRSKTAIMNWQNRVVLCRTCHEKYHHNGVSYQKTKDMIALRKTYLTSIGREKYI